MFASLSLTVACVATCSGATQSPPGTDPWAALEHKTGWVYAGAIDRKESLWVTQLHHRYLDVVAEPDRAFAFDSPTPLQSRMPRVGDVIEVTAEMSLRIVDFEMTRELRRLESPAGRVLTKTDSTGVSLPVGTRLKIREQWGTAGKG